MSIKKWASRIVLLAVVASCLCVSSQPLSASTAYNVQIPCQQAQNAVNFLLALDQALENELAEREISAAQAAAFDQYIDTALAYIRAHTASTCSLASETD